MPMLPSSDLPSRLPSKAPIVHDWETDRHDVKDGLVREGADAQEAFDVFRRWHYAWPGLPIGKWNIEEKLEILLGWEKVIGPFQGMDVLELGPHEGAITYCLESLNPKSILAIEGRIPNFLKCLTIKNHYNLRAQFMLGDFVQYLAEDKKHFDVILASGVMYHLSDPIQLIQHAAKRTQKLALDTIYYDKEILEESVRSGSGHWILLDDEVGSSGGFTCQYHSHTYINPESDGQKRFGHGSLDNLASLMSREDILNCLAHFGFKITWMEDVVRHNGPHIHLAAEIRR